MSNAVRFVRGSLTPVGALPFGALDLGACFYLLDVKGRAVETAIYRKATTGDPGRATGWIAEGAGGILPQRFPYWLMVQPTDAPWPLDPEVTG